MKLVEVNGNPEASGVLFELLLERPKDARISHIAMPSLSEHNAFIANHPFRYWYLIRVPLFLSPNPLMDYYIGSLECTDRNEIGVHILKRYHRRGYGAQALRLFLEEHEPLPAIKAVRNDRWLANIATMNVEAKLFFAELGFKPLQETWVF